MEEKRKIFSVKKTALLVVGLLVVAGFAFSYRVILGSDSTINTIIQKENKTPLYKQVGYLLQNDEKKLSGENEEDRINVLLMGMGGEGHAGGIYLADTIMIASFQPSTKKVALISIPRDMVVDIKLWVTAKSTTPTPMAFNTNIPAEAKHSPPRRCKK